VSGDKRLTVFQVAIGGDGQVTPGQHRCQGHGTQGAQAIQKIRYWLGFAGATADAFTLFETL
jgi:ATP-dependent HslUV protease subunit HslV